jgi:hypothetical protein
MCPNVVSIIYISTKSCISVENFKEFKWTDPIMWIQVTVFCDVTRCDDVVGCQDMNIPRREKPQISHKFVKV